jgi:hypothetical protein
LARVYQVIFRWRFDSFPEYSRNIPGISRIIPDLSGKFFWKSALISGGNQKAIIGTGRLPPAPAQVENPCRQMKAR